MKEGMKKSRTSEFTNKELKENYSRMNIDSCKEYLEIEKLLNSIEDISPKQKGTERTEKRRH